MMAGGGGRRQRVWAASLGMGARVPEAGLSTQRKNKISFPIASMFSSFKYNMQLASAYLR